MEPLVAAHLHLQLTMTSSKNPTPPSIAGWFQSAMTARPYKARLWLSERWMYPLCSRRTKQSCARTRRPSLTYLCGKRLLWLWTFASVCSAARSKPQVNLWGMIVLQERARWLNLMDLSDREKKDILDMPIVPEGIFGTALASVQQRMKLSSSEEGGLTGMSQPRGKETLLQRRQILSPL